MTVVAERARTERQGPARKLTAPGWYRALLGVLVGLAMGFGFILIGRAVINAHPLFNGSAITTVCMITVPLGFLVGLGAFDYWFRWISGAPTVPEDHSGHGGRTWRDYFRVNTDHKVIGIQYICTTFVLSLIHI